MNIFSGWGLKTIMQIATKYNGWYKPTSSTFLVWIRSQLAYFYLILILIFFSLVTGPKKIGK